MLVCSCTDKRDSSCGTISSPTHVFVPLTRTSDSELEIELTSGRFPVGQQCVWILTGTIEASDNVSSTDVPSIYASVITDQRQFILSHGDSLTIRDGDTPESPVIVALNSSLQDYYIVSSFHCQ